MEKIIRILDVCFYLGLTCALLFLIYGCTHKQNTEWQSTDGGYILQLIAKPTEKRDFIVIAVVGRFNTTINSFQLCMIQKQNFESDWKTFLQENNAKLTCAKEQKGTI